MKEIATAILGWLLVTVILTIALFIVGNIILTIASFLVWEPLYSVEATFFTLRASIIIAGVLAIAMIGYDYEGFQDAFDGDNDDED